MRYALRTGIGLATIAAAAASIGGCALAHLAGGMYQNFEYQKQIEVLPKYDGLEGQRVAVLVDADLSLRYEHPQLVGTITSGVTQRIGMEVPGVKVVREDIVVAWQWQTPHWNAMPYGDLAKALDVDRVVYVDINEYRLNPPGNRWLWEGVCAANIHVIERDGLDPDIFADSFQVVSTFPSVKNLDRSGATASAVQTGLLADFIKRVGWLFHTHLEPKYPDKFRPELQTDVRR